MNPEQLTQTPTSEPQTITTPSEPISSAAPPVVAQAPTKQPLSKLGLWSFLIPIAVVPAIYIGGILLGIIFGALIFDGSDTTKALTGFMSPVYGFGIAAGISTLALLVACGFGIASLFVKNKRKIFGIIGLPLAIIGLLFSLSVPALIKSLFS